MQQVLHEIQSVKTGEDIPAYPRVSIIIPLYNHERFIGRTLRSCLAQTCPDFEVIVVDDCSPDASSAVVAQFADPRITLVRHSRNRGCCAARNTGADLARAGWLLFLDDDDELVPTAVETILARTATLDAHVGSVQFRCQKDDGSISPGVAFEGRLDYTGYMRFLASCIGTDNDMIGCVRRETFGKFRFSENFGGEDEYHLDFHKNYDSVIFPDVVRLYHQDANDRLSKRFVTFNRARDLAYTRDRATVFSSLLRKHRHELARHAPKLLDEYDSRLLTLWLLCGERRKAFLALARLLLKGQGVPKHLSVFLAGIAHPAPLTIMKNARANRQTRAGLPNDRSSGTLQTP